MENIAENFTQEPWLTAGEDGTFIYALRPSKSLSGKQVAENVFDLKINGKHPDLRPGELEANAQLILNSKELYLILKELVEKMDKIVALQNNRDGQDTYRGFTTAEFDTARTALWMAGNYKGGELRL